MSTRWATVTAINAVDRSLSARPGRSAIVAVSEPSAATLKFWAINCRSPWAASTDAGTATRIDVQMRPSKNSNPRHRLTRSAVRETWSRSLRSMKPSRWYKPNAASLPMWVFTRARCTRHRAIHRNESTTSTKPWPWCWCAGKTARRWRYPCLPSRPEMAYPTIWSSTRTERARWSTVLPNEHRRCRCGRCTTPGRTRRRRPGWPLHRHCWPAELLQQRRREATEKSVDRCVFEEHEALDGFEPETLEAGGGLNSERTGTDRVEPGSTKVADPSEDVGGRGGGPWL